MCVYVLLLFLQGFIYLKRKERKKRRKKETYVSLGPRENNSID